MMDLAVSFFPQLYQVQIEYVQKGYNVTFGDVLRLAGILSFCQNPVLAMGFINWAWVFDLYMPVALENQRLSLHGQTKGMRLIESNVSETILD